MDPISIAALGSGFVGTALNGIFATRNRNREERHAHAMLDRAQVHDRNMWNIQNEYNDPSAQMRRLKAAGLNPNLIYGASAPYNTAGDIGNSKPAQTSDVRPFEDTDITQWLTTSANLKNLEAQNDNLKAQNTVMVQEAALKAAQSAETGVRTARSQFDFDLAQDLRDTSFEVQKENLRILQGKRALIDKDNRYRDATDENRAKRILTDLEVAKANLKGANLRNAISEIEKEWMEAGFSKNDPAWLRILYQNFGKVKDAFDMDKPVWRQNNDDFRNNNSMK
jgi:hypothetical protein